MTTTGPRSELDPPTDAEVPVSPEARPGVPEAVREELDAIIGRIGMGGRPEYDRRLVRELMVAGLKLLTDGRDTGELKLMSLAMRELRHAFRVFAPYPEAHKVTIFGSARTPPDHPDYLAAVEFSRIMAERGWMSITGAGDGIMRAGHEGPGADASFGLAIQLPFEQRTNDIIEGDNKLINFRYFFTRKLMFLSQAEAVVCFPGGFGTLDEAFETLTLTQTGRASIVPVVLAEGAARGDGAHAGPGAGYWEAFTSFLDEQLLARGWVSPEDSNLYYHAKDPRDAADHVCDFYRVYHSSRYVRDDLVIRLRRRVPEALVERLNDEFGGLCASGKIVQRGPYEVELDHTELPRLAFTHTRRQYGLVRKLIDAVNAAPEAEG